MNTCAYRQLLNLLMVSDPEPVEMAALKTFAEEEAGRRGFTGWIGAYHSSQSRVGPVVTPPQLGDIHLTSVGQHGIEVHMEVDDVWRLVIREHHDCSGVQIDHFACTDGEKPRAWEAIDGR